MSRLPADQETRDRIVRDVERSCLVEASAGTGKTRLLVERILTMLAAGRAVDRFAAITFTEKAAGELKTKLRDALEKAARGAAPETVERERFVRALADIDRATVTTIHAFCSEILKSSPVEARVSPAFRVADQLEQRLLLDEAREAWKETELEDLESELGPVLEAGGKFRWLTELTRVLIENRDLLRGPGGNLLNADLPDTGPAFRAYQVVLSPAALDEIDRLLGDCLKPRECRAFLEVSKVLPAMRRAAARLSGDDPRAATRAVSDVDVPKIGNRGRKGDWRPGSLDRLREILKSVTAEHEAFVEVLRSRAALLAVRSLDRLLDRYEEIKTARGVLDFQDLLIKARDLVRDHPGVRRELRETYSALLVDEFQDTDPLQAEIVFLLAGEDTEERDWTNVRVEPARLFLVGDPKQSIYRFRRADIQVYERAKRTLLASGGAVLPIIVNFRTRDGIANWVNRVFERLMPPEASDEHHPAYSPLSAYREDMPGLPAPVITLRVPIPPDGAINVTAKRRSEAATVARYLREQIESGRLRRANEAGSEAADYGDVAVLFRMTTGLEIYEDEFRDAGVPYRVEGGRYYFQRLEVQSLLAVLRAVDRPNDREALVAALRSPLFGFDDETLVIAAAEGSLQYGTGSRPSDRDLAAVLDRLESWHIRRHVDSPAVIVEEILEATRAVEFFSLQSLGEQRAANLLKVVDEARRYDGEAGAFRVLVEHLSEREQREEAEEESPISEETDRGFVRFLTVHKSKGLEFPVTILADLEARPRNQTEFLVDRASGSLEVRLKSLGGGPGYTPGWNDLMTLEKVMEEGEEKRLFYVAATRARDALVLPVRDGHGSQGFMGLLDSLDIHRTDRWTGEEEPAAPVAVVFDAFQLSIFDTPAEESPAGSAPVKRERPVLTPDVFADSPAGDEVLAIRERFATERRALIEGLPKATRHVTPSSFHGALSSFPSSGADDVCDLFHNSVQTEFAGPARAARRRFPGDAGSRRALELGSLVHHVLELVEPDGSDADPLVERLHSEYPALQPEDAVEARRLIAGALTHPVWNRAWSSGRVFREVPFLGRETESIFIDGFVDLVFVEENELILVDYKTDRLPAGGAEELAARYRNQALGYALGVSRAAGVAVREVILLFLDSGEARSLNVDEGVLKEARGLLGM